MLGTLLIGCIFNLTGGALAEWATMNAMVQEVIENLDTGVTTVRFGPPKTLGAGELVDILRVNRQRIISSSYGMRPIGAAGASGSADLSLGQNTPEKNSVSGAAPPNPAVVSSTPDGSGPIVTHSAVGGGDSYSQWINNSVPNGGQITIRLSDAGGQNIKLRQLQVCENGQEGTMYFLCSPFVPNS